MRHRGFFLITKACLYKRLSVYVLSYDMTNKNIWYQNFMFSCAICCKQIGFTRCSWSYVSARSNSDRQSGIGYDRMRCCWSQFSACSDFLRPPFEIKLMSETPPPTSALMQSTSTLLLSALIPTQPTTFYITSYWGAVVLPRFCSSQYVMCGCFFLIIFVSIVGDCLGSKIKVHPPYVSSVCKAFMKIYFNSYVFILPSNLNVFFINSIGTSRNFWHYQWPEEFFFQIHRTIIETL